MTERLEHLDPATIAALVDRTLDSAARAAAEAHLADCADCREVWMETSEMVAAERADTAATPVSTPASVIAHRPRTRKWIYAGAGLAAAAAVALAVFSPRIFDRGDRPELRALVEAVGENRRTEGRLTGGFKWGPVMSATRGDGGSADARVQVAASALTDRASSENARVVAAAGLAELTLGNIDAGLAHLKRASVLDPGSAAMWSDLAAAHLERARLHANSDDAAMALAASERALALSPDMPEAVFNRALALTYLGREEARSAWLAYLAIDVESPWATEVRSRLTTAGKQ